MVTSRHIPADFSQYERDLSRARAILRVQAKSFEMMRMALLRIDAIFYVGFENLFGPRRGSGAAETTELSILHLLDTD